MEKEKTYDEWYWKLYRWFKWDAKHVHKTIYQGIKNLIYWFPIIWKDRNWDQFYIYEILKHKLKIQAEYLSEKDTFVSSQQSARNMRICVSLIEKLQDDFYSMEYHDYHETDFDFIPTTIEGKEYYEMKSTEISNTFEDYFDKYPLMYKKITKQQLEKHGSLNNDKSTAMEIAVMNERRARKLLFKILEENIESWWD
jgi:hypothetical protein